MPERPWDPDPVQGSARQRLDRLMERLPHRSDEWTPDVDVIEQDDSLVLKADLAGLRPDDVEVLVQERSLILRGERAQEELSADRQRIECRYGRFERSVPLPVAVDTDDVTAVFEDGVLTVIAPKAGGSRPQRVPVRRV